MPCCSVLPDDYVAGMRIPVMRRVSRSEVVRGMFCMWKVNIEWNRGLRQ